MYSDYWYIMEKFNFQSILVFLISYIRDKEYFFRCHGHQEIFIFQQSCFTLWGSDQIKFFLHFF